MTEEVDPDEPGGAIRSRERELSPKQTAGPPVVRTIDNSSLSRVASGESRATVVLPLPDGPQNRYAPPSRMRLAACTTSPCASTSARE